jgi:hypothetical protein
MSKQIKLKLHKMPVVTQRQRTEIKKHLTSTILLKKEQNHNLCLRINVVYTTSSLIST